ncbi:MAG: zinc ribbon domain-containing protein [Lachnospiraceae bacterium]|nr:zinc ribbon domain-containing protein [Lachnospiraceae bacterium]
MKNKITVFLISLFACAMIFASPVMADTDEILNYTITVDVNQDATLNLNYHIDWKVLDSGSGIGPLTWMKIGIPNSHVISTEGISSTVDHINRSGNYVEVYLDKSYYEGDVASVDFLVVQDYMYQVDKLKEGETVYSFTPGWFDDIRVDKLIIQWNNDKSIAFSPDCLMDGGYNVWETSLGKGEHYTVTMTYPNDAYGFDLSKSEEADDTDEGFVDSVETFLGAIVAIMCMFVPFAIPALIAYLYNRGFSNSNQKTIKKTTRVKVTYYDSCPGCGAPRKEGAKFCEYCGKSLVKSEETITEEQLKKEEKAAAAFTKNGEYKYGSAPNTFIRVNSISVPNPHYRAPSRSSSSGRSHHSSCAHSSCACACACACAGGGRAGCTTKDFYNTDLKLAALAKVCNAKPIPPKKEEEN